MCALRGCIAVISFLLGSLPAVCQEQDKQAVERGRKLFQSACGFCHGNDATGSRGPDLIRSALVNHDQGGNLIGPVVKNGRVEKDMPAFAYNNSQISDLA